MLKMIMIYYVSYFTLCFRPSCKVAPLFLIYFSSPPDEAAGSGRRATATQPSKRSFDGAPTPHARPGPRLPRQPLGKPRPLRPPAHGQRILPFVEPFDGAARTLGQESRLGAGRRGRRRRREQRERALPAAELSTSHLYSRQSPQHQQHYQ